MKRVRVFKEEFIGFRGCNIHPVSMDFASGKEVNWYDTYIILVNKFVCQAGDTIRDDGYIFRWYILL